MDTTRDVDEPLLKVRGLYKSFGAVQALTDVNLDVPAGQVTALSGDNGAGKSVLIKCISGIYEPDRGQIFWEGRPVRIRMPHDASAPRHRDRLPGPRPGRQSRHRPEHVPGTRATPAPAPRRGRHGAGRGRDPGQPAGDDGAVHPPAGRVAVGRPAPVGGGRQGGDVELQAGHHGRADRGPGRDPDGAWSSTWSDACGTAAWR